VSAPAGESEAAARQRRAYGYAWLTVVCWASVATAFKIALRELHYAQLLLVANIVAVGVLAAMVVLGGRLATLRALPRAAHWRSLMLGLMNPAAYYLLLFQAYEVLPAQVAQPVNYTWAIALSLLAVPLLRQRFGVAEALAAAIAYSGVVVISLGSGGGDMAAIRWDGIGIALLSTVIWALYWIANSRASSDPVCRVLLNFVYALPFTIGACLWLSDLDIPPGAGLAAALWVGVFEMGLTYVFWQQALLLSINAARVSNLVFATPFLSLLPIALLLREPLAPSTIPGMLLILGGLLVQRRFARAPV
jgi:drug/metabolite transporter (DMT)-like permease